MNTRKVVISILAAGLAFASGACGSGNTGSDSPNPGTGGHFGTGGSAAGAGGTSSSSGGSSGPPPLTDDGLETSGGGPGGGSEVLNGGHRPLTAEEVAALTSDECSQFDAPVEPQAPVLELVVDVSLSMELDTNGCYPTRSGPPPACSATVTENCCQAQDDGPGTGLPRKWDLFLPAILTALDGIPDGAAVGMQLFPTGGGGFPAPGGGGSCAAESGRVPIDVMGAAGSAQRAALADKLSTAVLAAGTPTHDGLDAGQTELTAYTGPGKKFLILITDGEPTQTLGCVGSGNPPSTPDGIPQYTDPIVTAVEAWKAEGVGTFVVGSPGSEVSQSTPPQDMRPFLSKVASVGGTGEPGCMIDAAPYCHFDTTSSPDFGAALAAGLGKITELVSDPCTLNVPSPPDGSNLDKAKTSVIVTSTNGSSQLIQRDDSPADCTLGWTWTGDATITLCGQSCEQVKADVGAQVNASFGCETIFN